MKTPILTILTISVVLFSCNNNANTASGTDSTKEYKEPVHNTAAAPAAPKSNATIAFEKSTFNFGKIKQGEKVTHEFKFTNSGTDPLIISDASASCGCTVPAFPKEPIAPGKDGIIKVVFDSEGKDGMQNKVVTITSNASQPITEIYLQGEIVGAKPVSGAPKKGEHDGHAH